MLPITPNFTTDYVGVHHCYACAFFQNSGEVVEWCLKIRVSFFCLETNSQTLSRRDDLEAIDSINILMVVKLLRP